MLRPQGVRADQTSTRTGVSRDGAHQASLSRCSGWGGWVRKVGPARIWAGDRRARAGSQITVHVRVRL